MSDQRSFICKVCGEYYKRQEANRSLMHCPRCKSILSPIGPGAFTFATSPSNNGVDIVQAELFVSTRKAVDVSAVENFVSTLVLPTALEYYSDSEQRRMLIRGHRSDVEYARQLVRVRFPGTDLRILNKDPLASRPSSFTCYRYKFEQAMPGFLPFRTWATYQEGDPVLSILHSIAGLQKDERVWLQFHVHSREKQSWTEEVLQRLQVESQHGFETTRNSFDPGAITGHQKQAGEHLTVGRGYLWGASTLSLCLALFCLATQLWLGFLLLAVLAFLILFFSNRLYPNTVDPWEKADLGLIRDKMLLQGGLYKVVVRAWVWTPTQLRADQIIRKLDASMSQYEQVGGNRFALKTDDLWPETTWLGDYAIPDNGKAGPVICLNARELGNCAHPPVSKGDLVPDTLLISGVEYRAPAPEEVAGIYQIGESLRADNSRLPVYIGWEALKRAILLLGKTGMGKSVLMEHLMLANISDTKHRCALVGIDPHGDMVERLIKSCPQEELGRIRLLNAGDKEFLLTFNPLDGRRLGRNPDEIAQMITDIWCKVWNGFMGPRMLMPLRMGIKCLAAANELRPADSQLGLNMLSKLLLASKHDREILIDELLANSPYKAEISNYFSKVLLHLSPSFLEMVIEPVINKAIRFEEPPLLGLLSALESKLDINEVIEKGLILLIIIPADKLGREEANLVGSILLEIILLEVFRQGRKPVDERKSITIAIDEFQKITAVDWAEILSQLRKFGGRIILGTQSLTSLPIIDGKNIRDEIMTGVHTIFAFQCSGSDAEFLAEKEFSYRNGGPSPDMFTNLGPYEAFVKMPKPDRPSPYEGGISDANKPVRPFKILCRQPAPINPDHRAYVMAARAQYCISYAEVLKRIKELMKRVENILLGEISVNDIEASALSDSDDADESVSDLAAPGIPPQEAGPNLPDLSAGSDMANALPEDPEDLWDLLSGSDDQDLPEEQQDE